MTEDMTERLTGSLVICQKSGVRKTLSVASSVIMPDEVLLAALKGTFREYLFCTDRMVYIYKTGFLTGHFFGSNSFKMPYRNVTNVHVEFHLLTGYFEITGGGTLDRDMDFWAAPGAPDSPEERPNCVSICSLDDRDLFDKAASLILTMAHEEGTCRSGPPEGAGMSALSAADELRELKGLVDEGVITEEDFEAKKKQILGID